MFANEVCADVYRVIGDLAYEGVPIDRAVISRRARVLPEESPLPVFLAHLQAEVQYPADADKYAAEVVDAAMRRSARKMFESAIAELESVDDARSVLQGNHGAILELLSMGRACNGAQIGTIADRFLSGVRNEQKPFIQTGLPFVDDVIGPMLPGNLIVLGGATSSGKSALAAQIAMHVAERAQPVLFVSLEMEGDEIAARALSAISEVSVEDIEAEQTNFEDETKIRMAAQNIRGVPVYVESLPRATVPVLTAMAMKYQKLHGVALVIVDHLHYVRSANRKLGRFEAIEDVVMELKASAKQTKLPWLALAHLSRSVSGRPDKRPHLSDLYGASEIEKSADVVAFVHREQYWLERDKPKSSDPTFQQWEDAYARALGRAEIIVEKRRRGKGAASRMCGFDEKTTSFYVL